MKISGEVALPRIKVCGVTRESDLDVLATAGVDSVGLNFVSRSPRCIDVARAKLLCARAAELGLIRVAVVMDWQADEIARLLANIEVDFVQLHGQETPELIEACSHVDVIKAISWSGRDEEFTLAEQWRAIFRPMVGANALEIDSADGRPASTQSPVIRAKGEQSTAEQATVRRLIEQRDPSPVQDKCGARFRAFLVDAYAPEQGGGSGRVARWDLLCPRPTVLSGVPLILAGGLTSENVESAIAATTPDGVDTASGVEETPGIKSASMVSAFASTAARAFQSSPNRS